MPNSPQATAGRESANQQDYSHDSTRGQLRSTEGTRTFWAPEMLDSAPGHGFSGYASDIWAVGVCLFVFVFGVPPFKASGGMIALFEAINHDDPLESPPGGATAGTAGKSTSAASSVSGGARQPHGSGGSAAKGTASARQ